MFRSSLYLMVRSSTRHRRAVMLPRTLSLRKLQPQNRHYNSSEGELHMQQQQQESGDYNSTAAIDMKRQTRRQIRVVLRDLQQVPLGTMTSAQIEEILHTVLMEDQQHQTWPPETSSINGSSKKDLLVTDLLVNRLGTEVASGSFVARPYTEEIMKKHLTLIQVHQQEQQVESNPVNLDRCEHLVKRVISWYQETHNVQLITPMMIVVADLIQSWLNAKDVNRAAGLLLWWTRQYPSTSISLEETFTPLFQEILNECYQSADHAAVADEIKTRAQELTANHGWTKLNLTDRPLIIPLQEERIDGEWQEEEIEEAVPEDSNLPSSHDDSRLEELVTLQNKLIDFLKEASRKDLSKVRRYETSLQQIPGFKLTEDICHGMLDYYLRIKDSIESTKWLQRLDTVAKHALPSENTFDRFVQLLGLLAEAQSRNDSPWRATEILRRMEQLEQQGVGTVTTKMYNMYCKTWADSSESLKAQKIRVMFDRMVAASEKGKQDKLPNDETYRLLVKSMMTDADGASKALTIVATKWKTFDDTLRRTLVSTVMPELSKHGMVEEARTLFRLAVKSNIILEDETLSQFVSAYASSPNSNAIFDAMKLVKRARQGTVPFECFSNTMTTFISTNSNPENVKKLIDLMVKDALNGSLNATADQVRPLMEMATSLRNEQGPSRAHDVMQVFELVRKESQDIQEMFLSTQCINNEMEARERIGSPQDTAVTFDRVDSDSQPNGETIKVLSDALAKSKEGGESAKGSATNYLQMSETSEFSSLKPDRNHFHAVLTGLKNEGPSDIVERSTKVLHQMNELGVEPEVSTFDLILDGILVSDVSEKFAKVMDMRQMMKLQNIEESANTHERMIRACLEAKENEFDQAIEIALISLKGLGSFDDKPVIEPKISQAILYLFGKKSPSADSVAKETLLAIGQLCNYNLESSAPEFRLICHAWMSSDAFVSEFSERDVLIDWLEAQHNNSNVKDKLNSLVYNAVLYVLLRKGKRGDATRAEKVLSMMEDKFEEGNSALKPDTFSYHSIITCLIRSKEDKAITRAENVLRKMIQRRRTGDSDIHLSRTHFNLIMGSLAKNVLDIESAQKVQSFVELMDIIEREGKCGDEVYPDTTSFNSVLHAWSSSGHGLALARSEEIINQMEHRFKAGKVYAKPNTTSYNILMSTLINFKIENLTTRAEDMLNMLEQRYDEGEIDLKPDYKTYLRVIEACVQSGEKGAYKKAEQVLHRMENRYSKTGDEEIKPTNSIPGAVCHACAATSHDEEREDALETAFRMYAWVDAHPDMEAGSEIYHALLLACHMHIPMGIDNDRFDRVQEIFDTCCERGWVNRPVLRQYYYTVGPDTFYSVVKNPSALPADWTRNTTYSGESPRSKNSLFNGPSEREGRGRMNQTSDRKTQFVG